MVAFLLQTVLPAATEIPASKWIIAGGIVIAVASSVFILRYVLSVAGKRLGLKNYVVDITRRLLISIIVAVATIYLLDLLDVQITPLLGGLGISGIIVALALQPVLGNLVGSVLLNGSRALRPGDQINTNGVSGTVVDINSRTVEIVDFDGHAVFVPNMTVLENPIVNRTSEEIRRTILDFQVGYDADLRLVQQVVQQSIRKVDGVTDIPTAEVLVREFADSGVNLKALFWHPSEELTAQWIVSEVAIAVRETLSDNNITIPYPHVVLKRA